MPQYEIFDSPASFRLKTLQPASHQDPSPDSLTIPGLDLPTGIVGNETDLCTFGSMDSAPFFVAKTNLEIRWPGPRIWRWGIPCSYTPALGGRSADNSTRLPRRALGGWRIQAFR